MSSKVLVRVKRDGNGSSNCNDTGIDNSCDGAIMLGAYRADTITLEFMALSSSW